MDGMYECILRSCCSTSCPCYWWNPKSYLGPAALLHANRWIVDNRDEYTKERLDAINDEYVQSPSVPYHLELCPCLPKGLEPWEADSTHQADLDIKKSCSSVLAHIGAF